MRTLTAQQKSDQDIQSVFGAAKAAKASKAKPAYSRAPKASKAQSGGEADAGSMKGYDPNMGMPKSQVSNSGYKAPSTPAYSRTK